MERVSVLQALFCEELVFFDLDCAHGALFHAVAAGDAGILVYNACRATNDIQDFLGAAVDANAAAGALVSINLGDRHDSLLCQAAFPHIAAVQCKIDVMP